MERQPLLITMFGATGDLAARKLYPAIFQLYQNGHLSKNFALIGTARREWDDDYFRSVVKDSIANIAESEKLAEEFASHFYYQSHDVNDAEHYIKLKNLAEQLDAKYALQGNRIFYFSVSPKFFPIISAHLKSEHLLTDTGFNRLIIEKPFGHDQASAIELQRQLNDTFDESQIFRIDHYLGKEIVQAMTNIRFDNMLFNKTWNKDFIDNVQISLMETVGVEDRAGYYDTSGVTRDMIQNHTLQLLAVIASKEFDKHAEESIKFEKNRILSNIKLPETPEDMANTVVRGQYCANPSTQTKNYLDEEGVAHDSKTETYFAAKLELNLPEWEGVPFYIRSGKSLNQKATVIDVQFKPTNSQHEGNHLRIEVAPHLGYQLKINAKEIGYECHTAPIVLSHYYSEEDLQASPDDYERLIFECIENNHEHFAHWHEVKNAWVYIDRLHELWQSNPDLPIASYTAGSHGPQEADALLDRLGHKWLLQ